MLYQTINDTFSYLVSIDFLWNLIIFLYFWFPGEVEAELLHTYSRIDPYDTLILCVRVAVLTAVTLTVPIVLFPVSPTYRSICRLNKQEFSSFLGNAVTCSCSDSDQVRRAIQQMMFPNKTFNWPRHIAIAFSLLTFINLLVIFAPNILGIFGVIGENKTTKSPHLTSTLTAQSKTARQLVKSPESKEDLKEY